MFDPCAEKEHAGTWLVTEEDWLTMSMDKIAGKNTSDGSYRYTPVTVRFTIIRLDGDEMELRIKTFLGERKKTVMFSQMEQDSQPATPEEALELDTKNKEELHSLFFELRDQMHQTFVIVTHDEQLAANTDRVIHIKDGVVLQ